MSSRLLVALVLAVGVSSAIAAPVRPVVPCDRPVFAFGGPTVMAAGVRAQGRNDFATRMQTFFARLCGGAVRFETIAQGSGKLVDAVPEIRGALERSPRSIAFIHFPFMDIEAGVSVEQLLQAYRRILSACAGGGALCIIGGQQPVNSFDQEATDRQLDLEQRAAAAFGASYLPLYRHFQSESDGLRLMVPLDSGDGRLINDQAHDLLFQLFRRRLLEFTGSAR